MAHTLRTWLEEYLRLGEANFAAAWPIPFLMLQEKRLEDTDPRGISTVMTSAESTHMKAGRLELPVYPVKKDLDRNVFRMMVTVGRAPNNDIILPSPRVSKFHAFFTEQRGVWSLSDASSSNGTSLDGEQLEPRLATLLPDGSHLAFGKVRCTFLLPEHMRALLKLETRLLRRRESSRRAS